MHLLVSEENLFYTHYKVFGNIIIMAEPLNTEDEKDTSKFIENLASKLIE